jgi:acetoin utilization deacetylase AcuC-like enzyme
MLPYDAPLATEEQLGRAHSSLYVREILSASPSEGYHPVDPDTSMNPHTATAALRRRCRRQATDLVLGGEVSRPSAACARRATTPSTAPRWASAFSTTPWWACAMRSTCMGWSAWR